MIQISVQVTRIDFMTIHDDRKPESNNDKGWSCQTWTMDIVESEYLLTIAITEIDGHGIDELTATKRQLIESQHQNAFYRTQILHYKDKTETLEAQLMQEAQESSKQVQALQATIQRMKKQANESKRKCAELMAQNMKLFTAVDQEAHRVEAAANDIEARSNLLQVEKTKTAALMEKHDEMNQALQNYEEKHSALNYRYDEIKQDQHLMRQRCITLEKQNQEYRTDVAELENKFEQEERAKIRAWSEMNELKEQNKCMQENAELEKAHYQQSVQENQKQQLEHDQHRRKLNGEIQQLQSQIETQQQEQEDMIQKWRRALDDSTKAHSKLNTVEKKYEITKKELGHLVPRLEKLKKGYQVEVSAKYVEQRAKFSHAQKLKTLSSKLKLLREQLEFSQEIALFREAQVRRLMDIIPRLYQLADCQKDKYHAAMESVGVLATTLELRQHDIVHPPDDIETGGHRPLHNAPQNSKNIPELLALARSQYQSGMPFNADMLSGYIDLTFGEEFVPESTSASTRFDRKKSACTSSTTWSSFPAFRIKKMTTSRQEEQLLLMPIKSDRNGQVFLDRSKINTFLSFVQSRRMAASSNDLNVVETNAQKLKKLLITKMAELVSNQRQIVSEHAKERAELKAMGGIMMQEIKALKEIVKNQDSRIEKIRGGMSVWIDKILTLSIAGSSPERERGQVFMTQLDSNATLNNNHPHAILDFSNCGINATEFQHILNEVAQRLVSRNPEECPKIQGMNFEKNAITDEGLDALTMFLQQHQEQLQLHLKWIKLNANDVTLKGMSAYNTRANNGSPPKGWWWTASGVVIEMYENNTSEDSPQQIHLSDAAIDSVIARIQTRLEGEKDVLPFFSQQGQGPQPSTLTKTIPYTNARRTQVALAIRKHRKVFHSTPMRSSNTSGGRNLMVVQRSNMRKKTRSSAFGSRSMTIHRNSSPLKPSQTRTSHVGTMRTLKQSSRTHFRSSR